MERNIFRRRSKKKDIENLYKILGTRSNIGQDRIKEKYIDKLREFPPETYPEEFQEIRRAYEVLKDPKKRKQYDMKRKYGDNIEKTMEDIMYLMLIGNFKEAKRLLKSIRLIYPEVMAIDLMLAEVSLGLEEFEEFDLIIEDLLEKSDSEEKQDIIFIKFGMLNSKGYNSEALRVLNQGMVYITDMTEYHMLRIKVFIDVEDYNKAWVEFKHIMSPSQSYTIEDLDIFILWLFTAMELQKWSELPRVQNQIKKLFKTIEGEEELFIVKSKLQDEAESYAEVARYREADIIMQLLYHLDRNDKYIDQRRREIQAISKLDMELERAFKDPEIIPYVIVKIQELYISKYTNDEYYEEFCNEYPHDMMKEMEEMNEEIGYGIMRVKKRYPALYKEFSEELGNLFNQVTEGLNREQKRRLR